MKPAYNSYLTVLSYTLLAAGLLIILFISNIDDKKIENPIRGMMMKKTYFLRCLFLFLCFLY